MFAIWQSLVVQKTSHDQPHDMLECNSLINFLLLLFCLSLKENKTKPRPLWGSPGWSGIPDLCSSPSKWWDYRDFHSTQSRSFLLEAGYSLCQWFPYLHLYPPTQLLLKVSFASFSTSESWKVQNKACANLLGSHIFHYSSSETVYSLLKKSGGNTDNKYMCHEEKAN